MRTFYRVTPVSWLLGRLLVDVPYYSMVNLIAGRQVVPELMQGQMTGAGLARAAKQLLESASDREQMRRDLAEVRAKLSTREDPIERAADIVSGYIFPEFDKKESVHGS